MQVIKRQSHEVLSKKEAAKLFDEYASYVYRGALFLTGSEVLADDITQEVFIQVIRKYSTYDQTKPFKPWIYKIMLNKVRDTMKGQKPEVFFDEDEEKLGKEFIAPINVEETVLQTESSEALWQAVSGLSQKSKEVIYMHYYLEMNLDEVAKLLHIPLGTCKSRLNAGLKILRQESKGASIINIEGGMLHA